MNTILLSAGVACVIAAVVGGGLKAFNVEVPVVSSRPRQALLLLVGVGFLVAAWIQQEPGSGPDREAQSYRRLVGGACDRVVAIRTADWPIDVISMSPTGVSFHKGPLLRDLRQRADVIGAELDALWRRDAPTSMDSQRDQAKEETERWLGAWADGIRDLRREASDPITQKVASRFTQHLSAAIRADANDAMSALAGANCPVAG